MEKYRRVKVYKDAYSLVGPYVVEDGFSDFHCFKVLGTSVVAIVERDDGTVQIVPAKMIQFTREEG
jgi:hypothetical protein